jgi:hypothetical protein
MSNRALRSKSVADMNELEPWDCQICKNVFKDSDAKMIECQRCSDHFCIKCLNKTKSEYDIISKSDLMWFCIKCRTIVEEHIVIDLKIEQRCRAIMDNYEQRLSSVERMITKKCSEHRAREIVRDEIKQFSCDEEKVRMIGKEESLNLTKSTQEEPMDNQKDEILQTETVTHVIDVIQERTNRANNLIIFGLKENESDNIQERTNRANNLIIFGLKENESDNIQERTNRANNIIIFGLKENETDNIQVRKKQSQQPYHLWTEIK